MQDIYIRRQYNRPNRRPFLWIGLLVAALIVFLFVRWRIVKKRSAEPTETPAAETADRPDVRRSTAPPATRAEEAPARAESPRTGPDHGLQLLTTARDLYDEERLMDARNACYRILDQSRDAAALNGARKLLDSINIELVFTPARMPEKVDYVVQSGDTLGGLADRFDTTVELLRKNNDIRGSLIRVGDRLRILKGTFRLEVDKSDNVLTAYLNDRYFKQYRVGTGQYGKTPTGAFKVGDRIPRPPWWRPDGKQIPYGHEENVLGTHWLQIISIDDPNLRGYGIHGTWEPETIGKQASAGCIRLVNEDVEELFSLIPSGTRVDITE